MRIEEDIKLDFCDVLIKPKRSEISSRANIEVARTYNFKGSTHFWDGIPIFAANMDTTGTMQMARELSKFNIQTCLHKHYPVDALVDFFTLNDNFNTIKNTWYTLGINKDDFSKFETVYSKTKEILHVCIDVANGYSVNFVDNVKRFRDKYPEIDILAGNVVTPEMVQELIFNGVDIVKIGIGSGATCTTRKVAGVGFPQLSAVIECADSAHGMGGHICSDGGCTTPGDVSKAFAAGADFVMLGGMFSGCEECEGSWNYEEPYTGTKRKKISLEFYGMSSKTAMLKYNGGVSDYRTSEGKKVIVPYKGPVKDVVLNILGGVRSACTYVGASKLKDLSKCTTFIKVNQTHNKIYGE